MMNKISSFVALCRPEQYYKNIVIFLAIFFSGNIFKIDYILLVFFGFISLSLMSSVNYILNDIVDNKKDKLNKEKSCRPIAKGKIKILEAIILAFVLSLASLILAFFLNPQFLIALIAFFIISLLYSLVLKNEVFIDIISISINFVIRAISGALIIQVWISPWLIIGTFFLALLIATGKRKSELIFLGKNSGDHRPVLRKYSNEIINSLVNITATALILSYSLYCFLGTYQNLLFTLPIVFYILMRYLYLIYSGSEKARLTNRIFADYNISIAIIIYIITAALVIYA